MAQVQQAPLSLGQQASLSPASNPLGQENSVSGAVRGITDSEIRFGISAPFTGPTKELGQNMKLGIETAFKVANANGGLYFRQLRLVAADDGSSFWTSPAMWGHPRRWSHCLTHLIARCCFSGLSPEPGY
jgi:ABC-type branched-subunit amino acid transport system substrate-binding protein